MQGRDVTVGVCVCHSREEDAKEDEEDVLVRRRTIRGDPRDAGRVQAIRHGDSHDERPSCADSNTSGRWRRVPGPGDARGLARLP